MSIAFCGIDEGNWNFQLFVWRKNFCVAHWLLSGKNLDLFLLESLKWMMKFWVRLGYYSPGLVLGKKKRKARSKLRPSRRTWCNRRVTRHGGGWYDWLLVTSLLGGNPWSGDLGKTEFFQQGQLHLVRCGSSGKNTHTKCKWASGVGYGGHFEKMDPSEMMPCALDDNKLFCFTTDVSD